MYNSFFVVSLQHQNETMMKHKYISVKDAIDALGAKDVFEYPKYVGNGVWEIKKGMYTGNKGAENFFRIFREELEKSVKDKDYFKEFIKSEY